MSPTYESFFGLVERPFSLTPDPRYFFKSRSHGRAIDTLAFGLHRRERFLLVTGDLGVGKTTLCRMLAHQLRRRALVSVVSQPAQHPGEPPAPAPRGLRRARRARARGGRVGDGLQASSAARRLPGAASTGNGGGVIIIDEAHTLPAMMVDHLLALARIGVDGKKHLQVVFVAQPVRRRSRRPRHQRARRAHLDQGAPAAARPRRVRQLRRRIGCRSPAAPAP